MFGIQNNPKYGPWGDVLHTFESISDMPVNQV